jgi:hypothetical protein
MGSAAVQALPALFLTDTLIAWLRGWEFSKRFDRLAVVFVSSIALATALLLLSARCRRFYEKRAPQIALLIGSIAIALLAGELVSRIVRPEDESAPFHGHSPGLRTVFHPEPACVPGVGSEARFSVNSLGIRGPELPGDPSTVKVLCLGGSTTECLYLDDDRTWSHQLMVRLNESPCSRPVWVGDMGLAGFSSPMHLRFVEESAIMHRINYLVILVGFNDLTKSLMRTKTRQEFLLDDRAPLWYRSRILDMTRLRSRAEMWRTITEEQDSGGRFLSGLRQNRRNGRLLDQLPSLSSDLQTYATRLRSIVTGCQAKGVRPILLTQPVLWTDHLSDRAASLLWLGWTHDGRFFTVEKLRQAMELYNHVLENVCTALGADWVDLRSMNGREEFFYDDCHFTEVGAREIADRVSAWFRERGNIDPVLSSTGAERAAGMPNGTSAPSSMKKDRKKPETFTCGSSEMTPLVGAWYRNTLFSLTRSLTQAY